MSSFECKQRSFSESDLFANAASSSSSASSWSAAPRGLTRGSESAVPLPRETRGGSEPSAPHKDTASHSGRRPLLTGLFDWLTEAPAAARGITDGARTQAAVAQAEDKLTKHGWFDSVTEREAAQALQALLDLPPSLRSSAIGALTPEAFERMIETLPRSGLLEASSLLASTHDPVKKLKLWAKYHQAKAAVDASAERGQTADEGTEGARSEVQKENHRLNARRDQIVHTTAGEIAEEVQHLLERQKKGGALQEAEVDALIQRKEHEHRIEMKHNVNLTNDLTAGSRTDPAHKPTERVSWSDRELGQLESALGRLPQEHVRGNQSLDEIRRTRADQTWDSLWQRWVDAPAGGYTSCADRSVRVTDIGAADRPGSAWLIDDHSELARHEPGGKGPRAALSGLEVVVTHEIGHTLQAQIPQVFKDYKATAGWEGLDRREVNERLVDWFPAGEHRSYARGMVNQMDALRGPDYRSRTVLPWDGRQYRIDPYGEGFLSVRRGAVPDHEQWDYARTDPNEHFAEHYAKAVHAPESLDADLNGEAQQAVEDAQAALAEVQADPLKEGMESTIQRLEANQSIRQMRGRLWKMMREDVFHLSQHEVDAQVRLFAAQVPGDRRFLVEEFRAKAALCMTKDQLAGLMAAYGAKR